ncbi:MAG: 2-oxoglutarate dehydrogenase E1 component [Pseudolabrys sp.]
MNRPFPAVSADFIVDLYHCYLRDPRSVDASWHPFFEHLYGAPPSQWVGAPTKSAVVAAQLIAAYRWYGHYAAQLDPLAMWSLPVQPELSLEAYGLSEDDLDTAIDAPDGFGTSRLSLRELFGKLNAAYAGSIGFDCAHLDNAPARAWLFRQAEQGERLPNPATRRTAATRLVEADEFEQFMNRRFLGKKRFGAEGCEAIVPWFDALLRASASYGVEQVVIGGTARGRLNVMVNIIGKPATAVFYEMKGHDPFPAGVLASGDVPYHLGFLGERQYGERTIKLLYCNNPSHLEAIDGVAAGRVRALQRQYADERAGWRAVQAVTVHTDAAFAGQGVVAEALQLSQVPAYRTGGTIRIVINNQVGFTTAPQDGRSSTFCTDVAKTIGAPVLHVNGDDIDAVVRTAQIAAEYRSRFHSDIVVDLVCYRRRGHNEIDEPAFTQPRMYARIGELPTARQRYIERLVADGVMSRSDDEQLSRACFDNLDAAYQAIEGYKPNRIAGDSELVTAVEGGAASGEDDATGISRERFEEIGLALSRAPDGVSLNPKAVRQLAERETCIRTGEHIPWALGEGLAYASLAREGIEVRLSGQDTPRGAFSQRHFILFDQETGAACEPFNRLGHDQAPCSVIGSPLSEYSVLAFEYGYSMEASDALVVWEAQFGDFANVAQVVIDQFIATGEDKWLDTSGLTLLLPHGLEGQGPDHSSGRIERFLQMCARDNMRIANCSTPANFFHLLRAQAKARRRRPLVVFTPKSLLRHKHAVSRAGDFLSGTRFRKVIGPDDVTGKIRRVVLCSGKFYYDLLARMTDLELKDVAIVRLEQLYPFPAEALAAELTRFPGAEVVWAQEEPQNMGAWTYLDRRIESVLRGIGNQSVWPRCFSRPENPSTAIGTTSQHDDDQLKLAEAALTGAV